MSVTVFKEPNNRLLVFGKFLDGRGKFMASLYGRFRKYCFRSGDTSVAEVDKLEKWLASLCGPFRHPESLLRGSGCYLAAEKEVARVGRIFSRLKVVRSKGQSSKRTNVSLDGAWTDWSQSFLTNACWDHSFFRQSRYLCKLRKRNIFKENGNNRK